MLWTFRILAGLNGLMLAAAFLYQSPGEDSAGAGIRLGIAVVYALALAIVFVIYHFAKTPWVRVPMLVLLALPIILVVHGLSLSI